MCNIVNGKKLLFAINNFISNKESSTGSITVYGGAGAGAIIIVGLIVIATINISENVY